MHLIHENNDSIKHTHEIYDINQGNFLNSDFESKSEIIRMEIESNQVNQFDRIK